ncbi:DUF4956 domain-containing protein [Nocardioides sp. MAHUQ-72]|uniref:DUF4956 domain-containing protein n=1 Tax=unclassified Nocardioides TaxID=2615069 RepID=UPI003605EC8A
MFNDLLSSALGNLGGPARLGLDVLSMLVLVGVLYRRRAAAPEMTLVFTALNIGLFAAVSAIGSGDFPTGIGFGLFGLLSLVRLRSAAFTLKDVAYTFVALILALVNGLPERNLALVVALDVVLLVAIWLTDESRVSSPTRIVRLTLDRALTDAEAVTAEVRERMGLEPVGLTVDEVDFVRDTTRVRVRVAVEDTWWAWADAQAATARVDAAESEAAGAR